jgi:hypothetical protein
MRGWMLMTLLGADPETVAKMMAATMDWLVIMRAYPRLDDRSCTEGLEAEVEAFEKETVAILNGHAKVIRLCACSKRWGSDDIAKKTAEMGRKRCHWHAG